MAQVQSFLKLTWVELKLFARDPFATVFALVIPLIMLILLAAVFGHTSTNAKANGQVVFRGVRGPDYYMTSSLGLVIVAIGLLSIPIHLATYREQGVLRRFRASAIPAWAIFGSQIAVALVIAAIGSLIMVVVAAIIYSTRSPAAVFGVIVAFIMATLSFTALGFLIAALVETARAAQGITLIFFFLFWMLSGSGPPRAALPETARQVSNIIPLTHALIAIQDPWFGYGWNFGELLILAGITVTAAIPALFLFARGNRS
jgi:ABC-2 type transport system permease protein